MLLIGGAFQRKESWGRCEEVFLANMDVFTVDPPGWGAADLLPETYGVDFLADAVCHMLDERGAGQVTRAAVRISNAGGGLDRRVLSTRAPKTFQARARTAHSVSKKTPLGHTDRRGTGNRHR
ncbi:alpha/beta fold hydrolase [Streptomyces agglomeratus]|uniref:alpha/beta fold hydrolase n=1 Tax=Streptomyces agglomeratus TaxID=285458 RepID=UPI00114C95E6|nr:hypothetical protein [Streptomyces agglomeratus]